MSHPTASELLAAVRLFLKEAEGELGGRLAFHAKVAGNALGIVIRELEGDPDAVERQAFEPFDGVAAACAALRDGSLDPDDKGLQKAIRTGVLARLAADNPKYATFGRLQERDIP